MVGISRTVWKYFFDYLIDVEHKNLSKCVCVNLVPYTFDGLTAKQEFFPSVFWFLQSTV